MRNNTYSGASEEFKQAVKRRNKPGQSVVGEAARGQTWCVLCVFDLHRVYEELM